MLGLGVDRYRQGGGSDLSFIEGQDGPIEREAHGASRKDSNSWFHHRQCGSIRVHECKSPVHNTIIHVIKRLQAVFLRWVEGRWKRMANCVLFPTLSSSMIPVSALPAARLISLHQREKDKQHKPFNINRIRSHFFKTSYKNI